jgi:hypothetical protein
LLQQRETARSVARRTREQTAQRIEVDSSGGEQWAAGGEGHELASRERIGGRHARTPLKNCA